MNSRQRAELLGGLPPDLFGGSRRFRDDLQPEGNVASSDRQILHESEGHDVPRESREPDRPKDLEDPFFRQLRRRGHCRLRGQKYHYRPLVILRSEATKNLLPSSREQILRFAQSLPRAGRYGSNSREQILRCAQDDRGKERGDDRERRRAQDDMG